MCGIAGIIKIHDPNDGPPPAPLEAIPEAWLDILDESIKHRGPDGQGRFRDRATRDDGTIVDVALVHRRLSIIDHEGGTQPMVHDGERLRPDLTYQPGEPPIIASEVEPDKPVVAVVFNGCIYNHRELRKELEAAGHVFETDHSDTEVLVHGWREWKETIFQRISSMHALAYWDRNQATLVIARDRFGEKPIYFTQRAHQTIFASLPTGLIRFDTSLKFDQSQLAEWIAMGQHPSGTPLQGIDQLKQGQWHESPSGKTFTIGAPSDLDIKIKHRSFRLSPSLEPGPDDAVALIDTAITNAVCDRIEADVPIACYLSGGLDSSLIARAAKSALREQGRNLTTLCVKMPDPKFDESSFAAEVASILETEHIEVEASPEPALDLVHLIELLGLPFGDSSLLPSYWISRAAEEVAGVAIGGDGGDELFLGYERQMIAGYLGPLAFVSAVSFRQAQHLFPRSDSHSSWDKAARLIVASSKRSYRSVQAIHQHPELKKLIGAAAKKCKWNDRINTTRSAQKYDLDNYLPGDLLRKVDTASMACPIEVRNPMLDKILCTLSLTMSIDRLRNTKPGLITSHSIRKGLLKEVARLYFPDHIVNRPKQGFAIPIGEWFRSDYGDMRQLLYDHLESTDPFPGLGEAGVEINMRFVEQMLREHDAAGEKSINPWHGRDHAQRLYMLLVLSIWSKWLERVRSEPVAQASRL